MVLTRGGFDSDYGLVAFLDPNGIRPAVYGTRQTSAGTEYMVASSRWRSMAWISNWSAIFPGEAIIITQEGEFCQAMRESPSLVPCVFEHVVLPAQTPLLMA